MNEKRIDIVWNRIVKNQNETFHQIRGKEFTYEVIGERIVLHTTNQHISKSQIEEALELVPLKNTQQVHHLRAPSYIYAILMDERIRNGSW